MDNQIKDPEDFKKKCIDTTRVMREKLHVIKAEGLSATKDEDINHDLQAQNRKNLSA